MRIRITLQSEYIPVISCIFSPMGITSGGWVGGWVGGEWREGSVYTYHFAAESQDRANSYKGVESNHIHVCQLVPFKYI